MRPRLDLKALWSELRSVYDVRRKKARAEVFMRIADSLSTGYLLGPRPRNADARARRLYGRAARELAAAGFAPDHTPTHAEGLEAEALARLIPARAAFRRGLLRAAWLALPWIVIASIVLGLVSQIPPVRALYFSKNIAGRKAWRTSGPSFGGVATEGTMPSSGQEDRFFFHTAELPQPWVEIDLGSVRKIRRFRIENRTDCCQERGLPMVLETSVDGQTWELAARRRGSFSTWRGSFPKRSARYVRVRSERTTSLHLRQIKIYE